MFSPTTRTEMEKVSAACAMDWSIDLEKALRSDSPDRRIEAISRIGARLQQWSFDPVASPAVSHIYGLVPGEERLFANTILLRLADAFRDGDSSIRSSILKIFLVESKQMMKKGRKYNGIMAKGRVPNHVEMLKRVKAVFDSGDVEAKALALRLFGCWADLGKDSVQIRYMILLSLQSSICSEVRAALFAAGCFCRLSEDFACIVLEMLTGIVSSPETSYHVKLAAVRAFAKMRCSYSIANRAYKAGKELMLRFQEDELKAEMLSSLSKLAFCSSVLNPQQVDFLLSHISNKSPSLVRVSSLKCLSFLFGGDVSTFPIERKVFATLLNVIDENDLSPGLRFEVLQILHKIFCSILPTLPCMDMPDFFSLLRILKGAAQSSFKAEQCLALYLLVDIICSFKGTIRSHWSSFPEKWVSEFSECQGIVNHRDGPMLLVCDTILLIIDAMNSLVKRMIVSSGVSLPEAKKEIINLLNLILRLLIEYPLLAHIVLDRLRCLIQTLVSLYRTSKIVAADTCEELSQVDFIAEKHESVLRPPGPHNKRETPFVSELILCICRFSIACLNVLDGTCTFNSEVYSIVKSLVVCLRENGSWSYNAYEVFSLDIHADVIFNSYRKTLADMRHPKESEMFTELDFSLIVCWVQRETRTLEFTKKMLKERNYWEAYRTGVDACSKGAWFAAAFTFRRLMDSLQSDFCCFWVRSLMLLAGAESEIKLILFPKIGIEMINIMHAENDCGKTLSSIESEKEHSGGDSDLYSYKGEFAKIHNRICASEEILAISGDTDGVFYFQRWFLSLRSKILRIVIDMLGLLDSHAFNVEQLNKDLEGKANNHFTPLLQTMPALISGLAGLSCSLNDISKEHDLLAASFMDIDCRSFRNISRQALSCSILAFCSLFALYFWSSPICLSMMSSSAEDMAKVSPSTILKGLIERLWNVDAELALELQKFMPVCGEVVNDLQSRTETKSFIFIDRASLLLYKSFIVGILRIQEDSKGVEDEKGLHTLLLRGTRLLSAIIKRWVEIPFLIPKHFFRVRPCVGAELSVFDTGSESPNRLSVTRGFQLSLNLCIQLKNTSRMPHGVISKIYCILDVRSSYNVSSSGGQTVKACRRFQAPEANKTAELFELLLQYTRTDSMKGSEKHDVCGGLVTTCVCFEPNRRGLGFSTCLLDVSTLPEGSYMIKWHSCFIDRRGHHWSLLPLNSGLLLTINKS